jgi:hypothetical protein
MAFSANTYYVAPTTSGTPNGSITNPFTSFTTAISTAAPGDTIYVRGGTYNLNATISIGSGKNGTAANPYNMLAYPGETPVLDFRGETYSASNSGQKGINLNGSYWHIKGLTVQYAADNGVAIAGSNNIVEQVTSRQNQDSGFIISGTNPSNNLLLNCDSYGNFDYGALGENADGFAVKFRGIGPGNVISGARSYENGDDGFDFWQAEHGVTVTNSWSFHNGVAASFNNPVGFAGDGNGIKLGHDSGTHSLSNMLVWGNPANGVDINGNATALEGDPPTIPHGVTVYNVTSAMNGGKNFQFDENPTTATPPTTHVLRNNVSYSGSANIVAGNTADHNTFAGPGGTPAGLGVTAADFVSTAVPVTTWDSFHPAGTGGDRSGTTTPIYATGAAVGPRQADGSLPVIDFLKLAPGSHLIDAGVNVGLPYNGAAPDVGWFESGTPAPALPGDYNGDNVVDAADYIVWRTSNNTSVTLPNDATPGTVDDSDYAVWRSHFGATLSGSGVAGGLATVPEPSAAFGLALVATLLLTSRAAHRSVAYAARRMLCPKMVS